MLPEQKLSEFNVLVLTPAYGGQVTASYTRSIIRLTNEVWHRGMRANFSITTGSSLVTRARNEALVEFLEDRSYTHLLWVDADIGFEAKDIMRYLLSDLDVVAGVYPIKRFDWPVDLPADMRRLWKDDFEKHALVYPVNSDAEAGLSREPDADGFLEVTEAPTGLMCIKRGVFDQLIARYPQLRYVPDGAWPPERAQYCYRFFDVLFEESTQRYLSEDYAFCKRWRDIGGKVHICTQSKLTHTGNYEFCGDLQGALSVRPYDAMGGMFGRGPQTR